MNKSYFAISTAFFALVGIVVPFFYLRELEFVQQHFWAIYFSTIITVILGSSLFLYKLAVGYKRPELALVFWTPWISNSFLLANAMFVKANIPTAIWVVASTLVQIANVVIAAGPLAKRYGYISLYIFTIVLYAFAQSAVFANSFFH